MISFNRHSAHSFAPPFNAATTTDYSDWRWNPQSIVAQVWDGQGAQGSNAFISQLLSSSRALVRYTLSNGSTQDLTISLEGAGPVVAQSLETAATSRDGL